MTNEELATAVQAGRAGYGELWEQVSRFIRQQAFRWFTLYGGLCARAGVEPDDLIQCGFLALQDAVQAFEPERGYTFLAYMKYPLQNRFREACGIRTSKRDPLLSCDSLDRPAGEEGETTLGDLQPCQSAAMDMQAVIEQEYQAQLRNALSAALDTLEPTQRETIRRRFWNRDTIQAIADEAGIPRERVRQTEAAALRNLRRRHCRNLLEPFVEEIRSGYAYHGTGWTAWNSTGASSVERAAEKMDSLLRSLERDKADLCALLHITPEEL